MLMKNLRRTHKMKKIQRVSSAILAALMLASDTATIHAAEAAPKEIDGINTAFVSTFGKMSYGGASHVSYKTIDEGLAALENGGKLVFTGTYNLAGDTLGAGEALAIEGTGVKATGNVIKSEAAMINVKSDISFKNASVQFPEGSGFLMNGNDFKTEGEFDVFYTDVYATGERKFSPFISILSGDATEDYTYDIGSGHYSTVALASGNVNANAQLNISGGTFEKVVVGSFEGKTEGEMTVNISGGNIGELVIGAVDGVMNGNVSVSVTGGNIEKISTGAYGADSSFTGAVTLFASKGDIGAIGTRGDGKSDVKSIFVTSAVSDLTVEENAECDTAIALKGGNIVPVYTEGVLSGVYCYDNYGCAAEKIVSDNGTELLPENGVFVLPEGVFSGNVVSSLVLGINDEASFVAGYEDGTFLPQNNMTRAEAITLLTRIIANESAIKSGSFANNFTDIDDSAWYAPYIKFFGVVGLLEKIEKDGAVNPTAPITRGEFVQLIYNIEKALDEDGVSYKELSKMIYNVSSGISTIEKCNEFSDVDYTNTHNNAIYHAVVNGYVNGYADGTFAPDGNITRAEVVTVVNRVLGRTPKADASGESFSDISTHWAKGQILAASGGYGTEWTRSSEIGTAADGTSIPEYVKAISSKKSPLLIFSVANHIYKSASEALASKDITAEQKAPLKAVVEELRNSVRDKNTTDIYGTKDDPINHIYSYMGGPYVREVKIQGFKPGTDAVEIIQTSDTHFNYVNELDEEEQNPSVMSTKIYRTWLRDGQSVTPVAKVLDYSKYADQLVVTGDILDYLSHGCKELTIENLFRKDTDVLAITGNHDSTRVMQGKVSDPTTFDSRVEYLREFWPHDVRYASKVVKDKVMCIVLDNGSAKFWPEQVEQLRADLEKARENDLVVLIFYHIPLSTRNPADTAIEPIAEDKTDVMDAFAGYISKAPTEDATGEVYELITTNADIVKGLFCGHVHNDYYTEVLATYTDENGNVVDTVIPQYMLTATVYGNVGHVIRITVE